MEVAKLCEQAIAETGQDRLRTLTWIWDALNERPASPRTEKRIAREITLADPTLMGPVGESLGMESGLYWLVAAVPWGHRNGYVRVPTGHPWEGLRYWDSINGVRRPLVDDDGPFDGAPDYTAPFPEDDEIRKHLSVHGGLSYAGPTPVEGAPEGWWFGFDCAHPCDRPDPAINMVPRRDLSLLNPHAEIPTNAYVRGECQNLARQIGAWK